MDQRTWEGRAGPGACSQAGPWQGDPGLVRKLQGGESQLAEGQLSAPREQGRQEPDSSPSPLSRALLRAAVLLSHAPKLLTAARLPSK